MVENWKSAGFFRLQNVTVLFCPVVAFNFSDQGAEGKLHNHPHIQSTFVRSGRFEFSIDGEKFEVSSGDSFVIPSNAVLSLVP